MFFLLVQRCTQLVHWANKSFGIFHETSCVIYKNDLKKFRKKYAHIKISLYMNQILMITKVLSLKF